MGETRRLIQEGSNHIYVWTEALSKRKDMRIYDPEAKSAKHEGLSAASNTVPIELQGKTFMVSPELHAVLLEMGTVMVGLQEANAALAAEKEAWAAKEERLITDIADLTEQLEKATKPGEPEAENVTGGPLKPAGRKPRKTTGVPGKAEEKKE